MSAPVEVIYDTNFRDPVATLRRIADEIEAGKFGGVGCIAIALLGDTMEVFGAGPDSEAPAVGMLLHAGFMRMCEPLLAHGR